MRIEKINDNQIKFILTKEDLDAHNIKMSELAYGSDRAREFFRDMLREAYDRCGFDADNIPLMIEAIPDPSGSLVLMVTKVDNPDEFDSHFASLSNNPGSGKYDYSDSALDKLLQSIRGITPSVQNTNGSRTAAGLTSPVSASAENRGAESSPEQNKENIKEFEAFRNYILTHRLYSFASISQAIEAASATSMEYRGESSLIYDEKNHIYYIALTMESVEQVSEMQRILSCLTEYGHLEQITYARIQYLEEHCSVIIKTDAVGKLAAVR